MRQANTPACLIFFMPRFIRFLVVAMAFGILTTPLLSQSGNKAAAVDSSSTMQKGLSLAEQGRCREALPILKKSAPLTADKQLKMKGGLATVRCGLSLNRVDDAVSALLWLNREFPTDPDVLYVTTHAFSDLSTRASLDLVRTAPDSYQAHELNAEALEMQGKWDDAAAEYTQDTGTEFTDAGHPLSARAADSVKAADTHHSRGWQKGNGSGAGHRSQQCRCGVRTGRIGAAGAEVGRSHRTFFPGFEARCEFCGCLSRPRFFAEFRGPVRGSYSTLGNLSKTATGKPNWALSTNHRVREDWAQTGRASGKWPYSSRLRRRPKKNSLAKSRNPNNNRSSHLNRSSPSSGSRLLLKFHEGLETKLIFAFLNAIKLIRTEIFESLFRAARPRDLQLINLFR